MSSHCIVRQYILQAIYAISKSDKYFSKYRTLKILTYHWILYSELLLFVQIETMNQISIISFLTLITILTICSSGVIASNLSQKTGKDEGEKLKNIMILVLAKNMIVKKHLKMS